MSYDLIELWHRHSRPEPTQRDVDVQFGCHLEEIAEMLETVVIDSPMMPVYDHAVDLQHAVKMIADRLKKGSLRVKIAHRPDFLDSIADQVVTGIGVAYCAGMKPAEAMNRVNRSNWSKFGDDGKPLRDENGKIKKGPNYAPPDLEGLY